jgi:hypothetical protein
MAEGQQPPYKPSTDETRSAGDDDLHGVLLENDSSNGLCDKLRVQNHGCKWGPRNSAPVALLPKIGYILRVREE